MRYDTIIFDLDGTLLDTLDNIRDCLNHVLAQYGLREQTRDEVRAHVGNGAARLLELSVPGGREHPGFDALLRDHRAWYTAHCTQKVRPYPGILPMLARLGELGAVCAIVSNKPDEAVKTLNRELFRGLTAAALGERPGIRRKPAPDMVLAAMAELGAAPERTVYVGDSEVDLETAAAAGLPCISVTWGYRSRELLLRSGAAVLADTPEALPDLLA